MSVHVKSYTGSRERFLSTHPAIAALCKRASDLNLPMLGHVDPHDDTVFNRSQLRLLLPELRDLAASVPETEAAAALELVAMAEFIEQHPHRYLVFNGD